MSHADIRLMSCKLVTHWEAGQCTACNVYVQFSIFAMIYIWVNLIHIFVFWVIKPRVTLCIRTLATLACFVSLWGWAPNNAVLRIRNDLFQIRIQLWMFRVLDPYRYPFEKKTLWIQPKRRIYQLYAIFYFIVQSYRTQSPKFTVLKL